MKRVSLITKGKGALVNQKWTSKTIKLDLDLMLTLDSINKQMKAKKDPIVVEVPREKSFAIRDELESKGFEVKVD